MLCIKWDVERRVIADAKAQLFGAGVAHRQRMVHGLAVQTEGAGEHKIKGEAFSFDGIIRAQLQPDGVALGAEQGVLHVPGKAVLPSGVGLAFMGKGPAGQLARPGEKDGGVALPDSRVGLPEHFFVRCIFQADSLCTVGVHGQGQKFVVNGCLHFQYLLCPSYFPGPAVSSILPRVPKIKSQSPGFSTAAPAAG